MVGFVGVRVPHTATMVAKSRSPSAMTRPMAMASARTAMRPTLASRWTAVTMRPERRRGGADVVPTGAVEVSDGVLRGGDQGFVLGGEWLLGHRGFSFLRRYCG
ncbi:MAG: hypothetical protein U0232_20265 [Thermomicrobiales bacterium]